MRTRANPVYCGIDTTDLAQATRLIQSIAGAPSPAVGGIKLGLEFFLAHGAPGVRYAFPTPVRATGVGEAAEVGDVAAEAGAVGEFGAAVFGSGRGFSPPAGGAS